MFEMSDGRDRPTETYIYSTTGAIVLRISMGYDALPHNDPFIDLADKGMEILGLSINVGSFLVNFIPARTFPPPLDPATLNLNLYYSQICSGMVPWSRLSEGRFKLAPLRPPGHQRTL